MNERTRMTLAIVIAGIVLFTWHPLMKFLGLLPEPPARVLTDPTTQPLGNPAAPTQAPATQPGALTATPTQPVVTGSATQLVPAPVAGRLAVMSAPTTMPSVVTIGSAEPEHEEYALQLSLAPVGGGIQSVVLNDYKRSVDSDEPFIFEKPYDGAGISALGTRSITIRREGGAPETVDLTTSAWRVESVTERTAVLALDLGVDGKPVLTVYKSFDVQPRGEGGDEGPLGFDTTVKYTFANRTDRPLTVSSVISGPTFPPTEQLQGADRQVVGGYRAQNTIELKHEVLESFTAAAPSRDYSTHENQPLVWIGAGGNYFNALVRPVVQPGQPTWISKATATAVNPDEPNAHNRQVAITLETSELTLAPATQQELSAKVFFGPRWRALLRNAYYASPAIGYDHTLTISGSCAFCTFHWLVNMLMWLLAFFERITFDWGVAIILLVFVVRALLHPITKRAQINMAKMQKFGPEMERLKKKYANDKDALNRAMMQFYKEQGATPVLGCLPMFLQMPIWIALYSGLSTTFELRLQPFLYDLTWIKDLAKPDHLIEFQPTTFLFFTVDGLNLLPFLMAIAFWGQAKLQPKPPTMTPEQEQQQKMMQWMTLIFPVFLYSSPSGLNIYILTSTVFGIIENHIIRKHIKEQEAREAAGPTIVDAEVINAENLPRSRKTTAIAKPAGGGIMGWFHNLQERAEQLRQEAERKAREQQRKKK